MKIDQVLPIFLLFYVTSDMEYEIVEIKYEYPVHVDFGILMNVSEMFRLRQMRHRQMQDGV